MTAGSVLAPTITAIRKQTYGKPLHCVDTKTPIEIKCETRNVDIYYTLNGSSPNPFPWLGCDSKTFKYCHPIYLEEGKSVIKAIAIDTVKNRESFVVTKSFYVEKALKADDDPGTKTNVDQTRTISPVKSESNEDGEEKEDVEKDIDEQDLMSSHDSELDDFSGLNSPSGNTNSSDNSDSRFIDRITAEFENLKEDDESVSSEEMVFNEPAFGKNITQIMESLKCLKCSYSNHANPMAQFCSICGSQLVNQMPMVVSLPSLQQMITCTQCLCDVPGDVPYCIICENTFTHSTNSPYCRLTRESKLCGACSTLNPATNSCCTLCQNNLPQKSPHSGESKLLLPTVIVTNRNFTNCDECGRVNCAQARYCDWCGKMLTATDELILECPQCCNQNQSAASYCQGCGYPLQPPVNLDVNARLMKKTVMLVHSSRPPETKPFTIFQRDQSVLAQPVIQNKSTMTSPWTISQSKSVQTCETVSCLNQKWQRSISRMKNIESFIENYCKPCGAISPGKGYWRQQVEHIAGHLKTTAYNDSNFRSQIAKPKLSNIISTNVEEGHDEFNILLKFAMKSPTDEPTKKAHSKIDHLPEKIINSDAKCQMTAAPRNLPPVSERVAKSTALIKEKIEDINLGKVLQSTDNAQLRKVLTKCLQQQKNASQLSLEALLSWCINKYQEEMIPLLVNAGCDWKAFNSDGNPPLHEAILLKEKGLGSVKQLLKCGVDPELVNKNGQTAYELANAINNQAAMKLLTAQFGKNMLNQMVKTQLKVLT